MAQELSWLCVFSSCAASLALNSLQKQDKKGRGLPFQREKAEGSLADSGVTLSCGSWEVRSQINKADHGKSFKIYSELLYHKKNLQDTNVIKMSKEAETEGL